VPLVVEHLRETAREQAVGAKRVPELIRNLDNDRFAVREQAMHALAKLSEGLVAPALEKALGGQPSLEMKRRLEKVLHQIRGPGSSGETLRSLRALEVLELAGTAEAREALAAVARETPGSPLVDEAAAALDRLSRRPSVPKPR
jgi:hypothetical protein